VDCDEPILLEVGDEVADGDLDYHQDKERDRSPRKLAVRLTQRDDRENHGDQCETRHNVGNDPVRINPAVTVIL
jgi:hypothetical protein